MLHEPAANVGEDRASGYKMRLGGWMFVFYAIIYAGFVAINVISPLSMEKIIMFDLNLAVVYGFGLIALALVLALIYNYMCAKEERKLGMGEIAKEENK